MIHVITPELHRRYAAQIEEHFRVRHDIFVGERKWMDLARPDGREIDAYDTPETTYLLAIEDGRVVGGHRLFPTTRPHMISEVFPHLVENGAVPSAPDILEWSRFFVTRERRSTRTYMELMAAMQAHCLDEGIAQVTAVIEMWWLPRFAEAGFVVTPLGLPQIIEGVTTAAVTIEIRESSLRRVLDVGGIATPYLTRPDRPWAETRLRGAA